MLALQFASGLPRALKRRMVECAMRILVVEDDKRIVDLLRRALQAEGHVVEEAGDAQEGFSLATSALYDSLIVDWTLPGGSGLDLVRDLRQEGLQTPILMLTAHDTTADKVKGLDAGADDYLTKPFALEELYARLRALARRKEGRTSEVLKVANLTLDVLAKEVQREGEAIELSPKEFALLEYLMRNRNVVLSLDKIAENVWQYPYAAEGHVIDVYIQYLRDKVDKPFERKLIHTVRGMGYVLREPKV
jgi:DNA-binding response OmpR family regulator